MVNKISYIDRNHNVNTVFYLASSLVLLLITSHRQDQEKLQFNQN